ncbi:phage tail sheath protein FI [Desulfocucumis palustris]|uniref:Phage tail sheath protein FI n=1 Tax=Desulfocucumis palustris TaxID=1898651 RepID=A0A2L2XDC6_9FIRM|nr:phage tail sheath protein FI [Desulfocucumis palustris]
MSLSRIGIVGTFSRGPVNEPVLVGSLDQLVTTFGEHKDGLTGYLSMLGALAQGANDFYVIRTGGSSIASASKTLQDSTPANSVVIVANTPGSWANDLKVAVASGTTGGTFKLIITYGTQQETFDNLTLDNVASKVSSQFVSAAKVSGATNIPANLSSTPLAGGDDGVTTTDADYVGTIDVNGNRSGLKVLETVRCAIVICAQQYSTTIRNALLTHCANMTIDFGLRMAVLNINKGVTPTQAVAETAAMDSMRGILTYPWVELSDLAGDLVAPDGIYAGRLSVLDAAASPSNKFITGINKTERFLAGAELNALTQARVSPISLVEGRGFRFRNGVTLSSDPAWAQTNIRRQFDQLEMEIYGATQWAISENNTEKLREAMAAQIDNYLVGKKMRGEIYDFKPTICDDTNNTPETIQARILNTTIRVRPLYAADYIDHRIQRLVGNEE